MKRFLVLALAIGLIFGVAVPSMALDPTNYPNNVAAGGLAGSRHNLGSSGVHVITQETSEICIFCHTPHHGTASAPIWNRPVTAKSSYTAYGTTAAGTVIQNTTLGGASLACLSCHDAQIEFDVLINAPGKGNNGSNSTTATDMGWTFSEDGTPKASTLTSTRLNIGLDLSNDHPIGVLYDSTVASLRPTSVTIGNIDLTSGLTATGANNTNLQQNRWAVAGYITSSATIGSLLRAGQVECVSCHDPHFSNKSWTEAEYTWGAGGEGDADGLFLRRVGGNAGSGVCRTCHNK